MNVIAYARIRGYQSSYISSLPSLFPPGISSAMTLRMDAGAKGRMYKIGQAAKLLDVKPFVLRFWEGEFKDVLVPVRTPAGQRAYTESNVATVREIKRLLYEEGLTIEGAKKRLGQPQGAAKGGAQPGAQSGAPVGTQAAPQNPAQPSAEPLHPAAPASAVPLPLLSAAPAADAATTLAQAEAARATHLSATLAATLEDVARELRAIRDLLT